MVVVYTLNATTLVRLFTFFFRQEDLWTVPLLN